MLRYLIPILILATCLTSCQDDIFDTTPSTGQLNFSRDTIFLDTIFTNIGSNTRTFKVYNKSNQHIRIPSIRLGRGEDSFYRLNVNGEPGKTFQEVDILPRDSIYVFVEATIDFSKVTNPLYTDQVIFDTGEKQQEVDLVTLVQDAYFLFPERDADGVRDKISIGVNEDGEEITVEGFYLDGNVTWTREKPYVIYGYAGVKEGHTLTIEKGARIHFHEGSGLLVEKEGSLIVNGTLDDKVVLEGDRLEPFYESIPGQWGTIWLRAGSKGHSINHTLIKNNVIGILMDSIGSLNEPTLRIKNTEIYNTSNFGLYGRATTIKASNLVIGNNGQSSLACVLGGTYDFTQVTIANYWSNSIREFPAVMISNIEVTAEVQTRTGAATNDLLAANFTNCIIEGNRSMEFLLQKSQNAAFDFKFKNCLLRFMDPAGNFADDPLYDFENSLLYQEIMLNGEADFLNPNENRLMIGADSDAIGKADQVAARRVPFDILGVNRLSAPDIGAYQHMEFEE